MRPSSSSGSQTTQLVELKHYSYRIDITAHDNGPLCEFLDRESSERRVLIITNSVVGPQLLPELKRGLRAQGLKAPYLSLPDGERYKNLDTVKLCYNWSSFIIR